MGSSSKRAGLGNCGGMSQSNYVSYNLTNVPIVLHQWHGQINVFNMHSLPLT